MQQLSKCFLIDNDEEDQEIFSMALQEVNPAISCVFANNGVNAIEMLNADPSFIPSMIFIDMNMPLMNGKQCLQELKKMQPLENVPIYMYSTTADPLSISEVKAMGAIDFIEKPPSYKELTLLLSKLV